MSAKSIMDIASINARTARAPIDVHVLQDTKREEGFALVGNYLNLFHARIIVNDASM